MPLAGRLGRASNGMLLAGLSVSSTGRWMRVGGHCGGAMMIGTSLSRSRTRSTNVVSACRGQADSLPFNHLDESVADIQHQPVVEVEDGPHCPLAPLRHTTTGRRVDTHKWGASDGASVSSSDRGLRIPSASSRADMAVFLCAR
jgi:hypothetical protein